MQDEVFLKPAAKGGFRFNKEVADVFDDMVTRSVPMYPEITRLCARFAANAAIDGTRVYDLGCSTASTLLEVNKYLKGKDVELVGCDPSADMLLKAKDKTSAFNNFILKQENAQEAVLENTSVVIMNFTLQFIQREERPKILKKIADALPKGGLFVFSEKIDTDLPADLDNLVTTLYDEYKQFNGYADSEIANKRKALENVLVPDSHTWHKKALGEAGFAGSAIIANWLNFSCMMAWK
jgi:tRNA (cmo5U34)-methyltransferase